MLKKNTKFNRQGMTYNINSFEDRKRIMELKRLGKKPREIATIMNKKQKSIESVNSEERKSEYKEFKQALISYGLSIFMDNIKYDTMDKKKLSKMVRVLINQALTQKKNNEFRLLIPKGRKLSGQRRIKENIVSTIVSCLLSKQTNLEIDTSENLYLNQKNQISNDQEESQDDQEFDDQNDYFTIDPITPFHLGLKQQTINHFLSYQRINETDLIEGFSTNQLNTFELFKQSVEMPSLNNSSETQLSSN